MVQSSGHHVMEQWNSGIVDGFPSSLYQRVNYFRITVRCDRDCAMMCSGRYVWRRVSLISISIKGYLCTTSLEDGQNPKALHFLSLFLYIHLSFKLLDREFFRTIKTLILPLIKTFCTDRRRRSAILIASSLST